MLLSVTVALAVLAVAHPVVWVVAMAAMAAVTLLTVELDKVHLRANLDKQMQRCTLVPVAAARLVPEALAELVAVDLAAGLHTVVRHTLA